MHAMLGHFMHDTVQVVQLDARQSWHLPLCFCQGRVTHHPRSRASGWESPMASHTASSNSKGGIQSALILPGNLSEGQTNKQCRAGIDIICCAVLWSRRGLPLCCRGTAKLGSKYLHEWPRTNTVVMIQQACNTQRGGGRMVQRVSSLLQCSRRLQATDGPMVGSTLGCCHAMEGVDMSACVSSLCQQPLSGLRHVTLQQKAAGYWYSWPHDCDQLWSWSHAMEEIDMSAHVSILCQQPLSEQHATA